MAGVRQRSVKAHSASERWRNALAELEYAERHGAPADEVEERANEVIEARVAMFQSGVQADWALPAFVQSALDRDRELLAVQPQIWEEIIAPLLPEMGRDPDTQQ